MRHILSGTALASLALLSISCGSKTAANAAANPAPTIAVARATIADLSSGLVLTGEFVPFQEVDVMAKVSGYVKKINVDIGDKVQAGQQLAVLEVPEMQEDIVRGAATIDRSSAEVARARNELQRAESNHQFAHLAYTRLAEVDKTKPGLVAQQEIDDAHGKDLSSEAQVDAAKSALSASEQQVRVSQAEQGRTKAMFDYTVVTAPFAGVVTKRYANLGSMIQAGTSSSTQAMPIIRLSQNTLLRLLLPVPESVVAQIRVGQTVEVKVPSANSTFPGKVARVEGRVDRATRTMNTEVDVRNPSLVLVPGMYAEVDLRLERHDGVLAIPLNAIERNEGAASVYRVANNRIEVQPVVLGLETANRAQVKSGLRDGDLVVIGNRSGLRAGQDVKPKLTAMDAVKEPK